LLLLSLLVPGPLPLALTVQPSVSRAAPALSAPAAAAPALARSAAELPGATAPPAAPASVHPAADPRPSTAPRR
jgi:hypothetical protein